MHSFLWREYTYGRCLGESFDFLIEENVMKKTTFRPMVETLEDRVVLASGGGMGFSPALVPVVQPTIQVINWPMDAPVILPGASDVPIAKMKIVATRGVARF